MPQPHDYLDAALDDAERAADRVLAASRRRLEALAAVYVSPGNPEALEAWRAAERALLDAENAQWQTGARLGAVVLLWCDDWEVRHRAAA